MQWDVALEEETASGIVRSLCLLLWFKDEKPRVEFNVVEIGLNSLKKENNWKLVLNKK